MREGFKLTEFGEIPNQWIIGELGNFAIVNMGQSPDSSSYNEIGNGKILVQGNADIKGRKTNPRIWTSEPTKECKVGDIIMTVRAPVGAVAKSNHNACIGRGVCAINTEKLNLEYLYQFLISYEANWKTLEQGSTFTAVNGKDIRGIKFLIPTLFEQEKIASILSTVDEKIEVIEKQINQTQELKKGLMQQLLTKGMGHTKFKDSILGEIPESWEITKFGELIERHGYGPRFNAKDYNFLGNAKTIRGTDIGINGEINYSQVPFALLDEEMINTHKLIEGDLIMITTADCGLTGVFIEQDVPFIPSAYAFRIGLNKNSVPTFFKYLMQSDFAKNQVVKFIRKGTVANLPGSDILKFVFAIPPFNEQKKISEILTTIDDKLDLLQVKKETFIELKRGLMQQLLTGKILTQ